MLGTKANIATLSRVRDADRANDASPSPLKPWKAAQPMRAPATTTAIKLPPEPAATVPPTPPQQQFSLVWDTILLTKNLATTASAKALEKTTNVTQGQVSLYLFRLVGVYFTLGVTLLSSWTQLIAYPVNSFLLFVIYPLGHWLVFWFSLVQYVGEKIKADKVLESISKHYFHGFSLVNWYNPQMLVSRENPDMARYLPLLTEKLDEVDIINENFDPRRALVMLTLSTMVYESDETIHELCQDPMWDISFTSVPLDDRQHVYFFFNDKSNWIVMCFQGTNPLNLGQCWLDLCTTKFNARRYLFGDVHEGFYRTMCRNRDEFHNVRMVSIIKAMNALADRMADLNGRRPLLWMTGHSLGAALATTMHARWVKEPVDFKAVDMAGTYVFGSPRVGNNEFASQFEGCMRAPINRLPETRVAFCKYRNANDMVTHVPFGYDRIEGSYMQIDIQSVMDFYHVGPLVWMHTADINGNILEKEETISLRREGNPPTNLDEVVYRVLYRVRRLVRDVLEDWRFAMDYPSGPGRLLYLLTPFFILDHTPAMYYHNLKAVLNSPIKFHGPQGQPQYWAYVPGESDVLNLAQLPTGRGNGDARNQRLFSEARRGLDRQTIPS